MSTRAFGKWFQRGPPPDRARFDLIIVGSGISGCVVAYRIARANPHVRIALLEAGARVDHLNLPDQGERGVLAALTSLFRNPRSAQASMPCCSGSVGAASPLSLAHLCWPDDANHGRALGGSAAVLAGPVLLRGHRDCYARMAKRAAEDLALITNNDNLSQEHAALATQWGWEQAVQSFVELEALQGPTSADVAQAQRNASAGSSSCTFHGRTGPLAVSYPSTSLAHGDLNALFQLSCSSAGVPVVDDVLGGGQDGLAVLPALVSRRPAAPTGCWGDGPQGPDAAIRPRPIRPNEEGRRCNPFSALLLRNHGAGLLLDSSYSPPPNLCVFIGCLATKLITSADNSAVTGVECVAADRRTGAPVGPTVVAEIEGCKGGIVLAAGGLRSAEILLRSGIGPAKSLLAAGVPPLVDLPVGQGVIEGGQVSLSYSMEAPARGRSLCWWNIPYLYRHLREFIQDGTGLLTGYDELAAFVTSTEHAVVPDIMVRFRSAARCGDFSRYAGYSATVTHLLPAQRGELRLVPCTGGAQRSHRLEYIPGYGSGKLGQDGAALDEGVRWATLLIDPRSGLTCDVMAGRGHPFAGLKPRLEEPGALSTLEETKMFILGTVCGSGNVYGSCAAGRVVHPIDLTLLPTEAERDKGGVGMRGLVVADTSVVPTAHTGNKIALGQLTGSIAARTALKWLE